MSSVMEAMEAKHHRLEEAPVEAEGEQRGIIYYGGPWWGTGRSGRGRGEGVGAVGAGTPNAPKRAGRQRYEEAKSQQ